MRYKLNTYNTLTLFYICLSCKICVNIDKISAKISEELLSFKFKIHLKFNISIKMLFFNEHMH